MIKTDNPLHPTPAGALESDRGSGVTMFFRSGWRPTTVPRIVLAGILLGIALLVWSAK